MSAQNGRIQIEYEDPYPNGFTQIDNRDIWDRCDKSRKLLLRPTTLGVLVAMHSLPKGWQFHESWLIERLGIGRDALRRAIRELEKAKRLDRTEWARDGGGRYARRVWRLLRPESPRAENPSTENPSMGRASPLTGSPSTAKPNAGRSAPLVITERAIEERTTTNSAQEIQKIVASIDWQFLPQFSMDECNDLARLIRTEPASQHQDLVDELAGAIGKSMIKAKGPGLGWLRGAIKNGFVPNHCREIQAERRRRLAPKKDPLASPETPEERDVKLALQDFRYGLIDAAELERKQIAIREKYGHSTSHQEAL